jgi:hypothetical protein
MYPHDIPVNDTKVPVENGGKNMTKRDEFVNGLKSRLHGMTDQIAKIEERVKKVVPGSRDRLRARIQYLKDKRDTALTKLQDVKTSGVEAWEGLKSGAEYTVNALNNALTKTLSHFKKPDKA